MTRITPRTCLYPLTGALLLTFALSLGLTFRSDHHCFAGVCGEWLFPLQARLHVLVWYLWLATSVSFLAIRAFHPQLRRFLRTPLFKNKLPLLGKHLCLSGGLVVLWVSILYGVIVSIWWKRLSTYFGQRQGSAHAGADLIAAIALTGHFADVTMGMVIIPVSRHSALASFFQLSVSSTLTFHMLSAYVLFFLIVLHAFLYVAWTPVFQNLNATLRHIFPVLNPTYLYDEVFPGSTSALGKWRASLVFTGTVSTAILLVVSVTTLPWVRKRHFNAFYFTHLFGIVAIVVVCLHASTLFYCTAPGLAMWVLDWAMRIYELRETLAGQVTDLTHGWFLLSLNMPHNRLDGCACRSPLAHFYIYSASSSARELHPFTTVTHLGSGRFLTAPGSRHLQIQFLFRKRGAESEQQSLRPTTADCPTPLSKMWSRLQNPRRNSQWTDRLAGLATSLTADSSRSTEKSAVHTVDSSSPTDSITVDHIETIDFANTEAAVPSPYLHDPTSDSPFRRSTRIPLHLEGPYFTPSDPAAHATVICLVAGTGVSGALAIAHAFAASRDSTGYSTSVPSRRGSGSAASRPTCAGLASATAAPPPPPPAWRRCLVLWSVRAADHIDLLAHFPALHHVAGLDFRAHLTGAGRARLDARAAVADVVAIGKAEAEANGQDLAGARGGDVPSAGDGARSYADVWVYISGPNAFIEAGETACRALGVEYYGARWDV